MRVIFLALSLLSLFLLSLLLIFFLSTSNMMLPSHNNNSSSNLSISSIGNLSNLSLNNHSNHNINNMDSSSNTSWSDKLSLSDITVAEILDIYKHDTELLKHILAAKTEEDKRRGAEELRRAEEARLHSKFIDLQLDQNRRSSLLDDTSLGLSANDWLSQVNSRDLLSPSFLNNTPPSPSQLQPLSPYTLFEVPFADLNLSAPSSPEPTTNPPALMVEKITLTDDPPPPPSPPPHREHLNDLKEPETNKMDALSPPPPPTPPTKERASCKRTLSRTRSTRKPSIKVLAKKNRSQPSNETTEEIEKVKEELPLDHDKVMEALRAKLQRSTQQQKEQKNVKEEITSMSPSGILLLDLKNPRRSFPVRPKATPRASVVRRPHSFISAHKPKEQSL
ncbi:uncharacterized protein B0P05DRAFT_573479 [Gilbertella persicaria]|uniref:uncharacterized protein n=1 Tax=Gilbertella persicaria TaxID=101096 RepID=UPI00221F71B6|nr:uncharacterized protein B0P05DRAFT_573479 [Gilbertella persicaria]KAI8069856.1 hypothetical protein B0P05DRAFT_573479 [Gilbertella persicaria]